MIEPVKNIIKNYSAKSLIGEYKFPPSREGKSIDVKLGKYGIGKDRISIKKAKEKFKSAYKLEHDVRQTNEKFISNVICSLK